MKECSREKNSAHCSCTYHPCPRKGVCCECIAFHRKSGELPGCLFSREAEKTYDRSAEKFISSQAR